MANEVTIVETGDVRDYTIVNAQAVEKGTLMFLTDPRTCSGASGTANPTAMYAGFAATEKVASDGSTNLGCLVKGVVKVTASGSIAVGESLTGAEANKVCRCLATDASGAHVIGYSLETATTGETFEMRVDL